MLETSPEWPMQAILLPWCRAGWPVCGGQDHGGEWAEPGEHHNGQRREGPDRQQPPAHDGEAHGPCAGHQILQGEDHMVRRPVLPALAPSPKVMAGEAEGTELCMGLASMASVPPNPWGWKHRDPKA